MDLTISPIEDKEATDTSDPVKDVTLATFMADVIEASRAQPVIVDFWAKWCGPCKQLGPLLEKLVRAQNGSVRLAKIDIDRDPEIAKQMRVQSIPAVFAFMNGQPVDGFMGALPESRLKEWIERLLKAGKAAGLNGDAVKTEAAFKQAADFFAAGHADAAQSIYGEILERDPGNAAAYAGLLRCLMERGEAEEAQALFAQLPVDLAKDKAFDSLRSAFELAEQAKNANGSLSELMEKVKENPGDHKARFDLALAYYAADKREEAMDSLLEIVRRDRKWNDEAARKQLIKLFESFGYTDPLTVSARKRLSSILFS